MRKKQPLTLTLSCILSILCVHRCYRLLHVLHAEGWAALHSSYQTPASCISVRVKALSDLVSFSVVTVHYRLVSLSFSLPATCQSVSQHWIANLVTEVLVCPVPFQFLFLSNFYFVKLKFLMFLCLSWEAGKFCASLPQLALAAAPYSWQVA